jgi:hypothetical protein
VQRRFDPGETAAAVAQAGQRRRVHDRDFRRQCRRGGPAGAGAGGLGEFGGVPGLAEIHRLVAHRDQHVHAERAVAAGFGQPQRLNEGPLRQTRALIVVGRQARLAGDQGRRGEPVTVQPLTAASPQQRDDVIGEAAGHDPALLPAASVVKVVEPGQRVV